MTSCFARLLVAGADLAIHACRPALAAVAVVLALATGAAGQPYSSAQRVAGQVWLGSKQVPLPEGDWQIAGYGTTVAGDGGSGAYGAIENLIVFRVVAGRVDAFAEISVNALPAIDGWGLSRQCLRSDLFLTVTNYRSGFDGSCYFVKRTVLQPSGAPHKTWAEARAYATRSGLSLPDGWVTVGFRVFDRQDVIDARYHFDPVARGLDPAGPANAELWTSSAVEADRARFGFVEDLSLWGAYVAPSIEKGLRNRLEPSSALPVPGAEAVRAARPDVGERLSVLDRLYAQQAITEAHHRRQREAVLAEQKSMGDRGWFSQSLQKNISFRVFGSIVDWILAFTVTLSSPISTGITASIVAIHSVIFVFNDRYWDNYWAERGRRDGTQVVDFTHVGVDI